MSKTIVKESYQDTKNDVSKVLDFLTMEVSKTPDKLNWGHVADLIKIRRDLIEVLSYISPFSIQQIEETLLETS